MHCLEIKGLRKKYSQDTIAIRDLDFFFEPCSGIIVLIGPNGAGKTTLLRILAAQLRPTRGVVRVLGLDVVRDTDKVAEKTVFLPQAIRAPFYTLTPRDYIVSYLMIRGYGYSDATRRAREVISLFELDHYSSVKVSRLSGGTMRKVFIAAVLADENANLVLLDEPLPGLDIRSRILFWNMVRRISKEKLVIISSHYTEEVPLIADYGLVMSRGRKVAEGKPAEIVQRVFGDCLHRVILRPRHNMLVGYEEVLRNLIDNSVCKAVRLSEDMVILYVRDPSMLITKAREAGFEVILDRVGIGDVVLALGERDEAQP
ncbi:hypothetical protein PYJP_12460 [Pyrofollis japonicus]|uniref:ABC transporter ATP-binding protein n=1 Tax=Pyrofollis japonicus TaxID=3060460 RepID=UPI00295B2123|nr:ABC transporter ATP-binding protein [Pyrofollis japonicus]BEP17894.1 hypothetical protein PYJP_12460 [Pyrofollis japonicus]